jgi:hypothetical protein
MGFICSEKKIVIPGAVSKLFGESDSVRPTLNKIVELGNREVFSTIEMSCARCVQCGKHGLLKQLL